MIDGRELRRGDVVLATVPFPSSPEQSKMRPVVVIQNDVGNRFSPNVIVANISSQVPSRAYPTNLIIRQGAELHVGSGLDRDSVVQAENIFTINKSVISQKIGTFGNRAMQLIDQCLRLSLGLEKGA